MKLKIAAGGFILLISCISALAQDLKMTTEVEKLYVAMEPDAKKMLDADAEELQWLCTSNTIYGSEHDCACIVGRFIETRLTTDPQVSYNNAMDDLRWECPNPIGMIVRHKRLCVDRLYNVEEKARANQCECEAIKRAEGSLYDMQVRGRWGRGQPDYAGECASGTEGERPANWPRIEAQKAEQ